jgi:hypothetical protein
MPPVPDWIAAYGSPWFARVAVTCPACGWGIVAIGVSSVLFLLWSFARGHRLAEVLPRPAEATASRAFPGLMWLIAIVAVSFATGLRGLVPLLGDTLFVAIGQTVALEWYAWWALPKWAGKLTELAVLALLWGLGWMIAHALPPGFRWPALAVSVTLTIYFFGALLLSGVTRRIVLYNVMVPIVITAFVLPREYWPEVSTTVVWIALSLTLAWLAPVLGAWWLRLPDIVTNTATPAWFILIAFLGWLGVPLITE